MLHERSLLLLTREEAKKEHSWWEVKIEEIYCRGVDMVVENLKCLLLGVFGEVFIS